MEIGVMSNPRTHWKPWMVHGSRVLAASREFEIPVTTVRHHHLFGNHDWKEEGEEEVFIPIEEEEIVIEVCGEDGKYSASYCH